MFLSWFSWFINPVILTHSWTLWPLGGEQRGGHHEERGAGEGAHGGRVAAVAGAAREHRARALLRGGARAVHAPLLQLLLLNMEHSVRDKDGIKITINEKMFLMICYYYQTEVLALSLALLGLHGGLVGEAVPADEAGDGAGLGLVGGGGPGHAHHHHRQQQAQEPRHGGRRCLDTSLNAALRHLQMFYL